MLDNPASANGYEPHTIYNNFTEKQRATEHAWRSGSNPLPTHTRDWSNDKKPRLRDVGSQASTFMAQARRIVSRQWPFQRANNTRTQLMSMSKLTLTSASPPLMSPNVVFVLLCCLWYASSAMSSNTGKAILTQFRYPVTLTFVQFGFVASYCLLFMSPVVRFARLRPPTKAILRSTLPMGMFQVGGHVFSSVAISRIPVSTVHTIKALSPLFTVAAYALLFGVSYSAKTYISLLPLTLGVMLACSFEMSASNVTGLLCAFGSAIVFVSSNIFFKKIMPSPGGLSQSSSHKLDKLNLLFYSSGMAFVLMIPIWVYCDLPLLLSSASNPNIVTHPAHGHATPHSVTYYFFMNGTVHFAQNIIAFVILSSTSPVTYSIASLIKRVVVICIAIVWFNQTIHPIQSFGIGMTFFGLYMYNNAKSDVERGEKKMRRVEAARDMILPSTKADTRIMNGTETPPSFETEPQSASTGLGPESSSIYGRPRAPTVNTHPPHAHNTRHPSFTPALTIMVTPPTKNDGTRMVSPLDSYPSPPPSLDSPPSKSVPLGYAEQSGKARLEDIQERLGPALEQYHQH